ncbi:MAG: hypothetical protein KKH94_02720 [Candidatus Omnitrophica bacterium]|nr:hypothetical protein [Candidatus Omnitrophota bacterium]
MDDEVRYEIYQQERLERREVLCGRCGECCGAHDGDPCRQLRSDEKTGNYFCADYQNRLGVQKTKSGKSFTCVTIAENFYKGALRPDCMYVRYYR